MFLFHRCNTFAYLSENISYMSFKISSILCIVSVSLLSLFHLKIVFCSIYVFPRRGPPQISSYLIVSHFKLSFIFILFYVFAFTFVSIYIMMALISGPKILFLQLLLGHHFLLCNLLFWFRNNLPFFSKFISMGRKSSPIG